MTFSTVRSGLEKVKDGLKCSKSVQAPRESSRQSAFTASNPRSAALQRAATAQVRAGGTDAGASLSSPTVTTLPASLAQATGAALF